MLLLEDRFHGQRSVVDLDGIVFCWRWEQCSGLGGGEVKRGAGVSWQALVLSVPILSRDHSILLPLLSSNSAKSPCNAKKYIAEL